MSYKFCLLAALLVACAACRKGGENASTVVPAQVDTFGIITAHRWLLNTQARDADHNGRVDYYEIYHPWHRYLYGFYSNGEESVDDTAYNLHVRGYWKFMGNNKSEIGYDADSSGILFVLSIKSVSDTLMVLFSGVDSNFYYFDKHN